MKFSTSAIAVFLSVAASCASLAIAAGDEESNEFEWAGTFLVNHPTHTWIMQKTGTPLAYVDPSMKLAVLSSTAISARRKNRAMAEAGCEPEDPIFEQLEEAANALLAGDCTQVQEGETFGPFNENGECFELVNDQNKDTSMFTMNTADITGKVIFAQHVPIEFERDMHYLKDPTDEDVEPVSEKGGGHHEHSHGDDDDEDEHTCACEAEEMNVNLDCSNTAAMEDALTFLKNNGCACDCDSDECKKSWLIVQAHHDHCDPSEVPGAVNDDFHDFDEVCESCAIERIFIEGAPKCPTPNCEDKSGDEAYAAMATAGCANDCSSQACKDNYIILKTVHDSCEHNVLSPDSEEGLHDMEKACLNTCNTLTSAEESAAQLECTEGNDSTSGASSMRIGAAACAMGALAFLN